jgi:hypothetical protein
LAIAAAAVPQLTKATAAAPNNSAEDFKNLRRETGSFNDIRHLLPFKVQFE